MESCPICTNTFTSCLRKEIVCPKCQYKACLTCYKQYISTSKTLVCINPDCKAELPDEVIYNNFPRTYIQKDYKGMLLDRVYQEERSMIPQTMVIIDRREQAKELQLEISDLEAEVRQKRYRMNRLNHTNLDKDEVKEVSTFVNKCPGDDCRGFLNRQYSCGVCKKRFCSACLEPKTDGHECDPDTVRTIKLLKKDSKSCPNCAVLIYKIEGCNQMYCTVCHTSFDWSTGRIVTKNIHNPHYFQYMREHGGGHMERAAGDIPCGGIPNRWEIEAAIKKKGYGHLSENFDGIIQFAMDIRHDKLPKFLPANQFQFHLENRIKFVKKEITEAVFKKQLKRYNTTELKKQKIHQILSTVAILFEDQLRNVFVNPHHKEIIEECSRIVTYINGCFENNDKLYGLSMPRITFRDNQRWDPHTRKYITYKDCYYRLSYTALAKKVRRPKVTGRINPNNFAVAFQAVPDPVSDSDSDDSH